MRCQTLSVTVANQLAGAMGLASWRAHLSFTDYAASSPGGKTFAGGKKSPPKAKAVMVTDLNEIGVTDSVMAALWGSGPFGSAAATTGPAEKHYLGADIAIIDQAANRLLLYQAKVGHLVSSTDLKLKSKVTASQTDASAEEQRYRRRYEVRHDWTFGDLPDRLSAPHAWLRRNSLGPRSALVLGS